MPLFQTILHYFLHFGFPVIIAWIFFRGQLKKTILILWLTMLIDLDHLLATPLFDACRCSINFHPLHSYPAIAVYVILLFVPKCRIIAIGLLLHILTDQLDCLINLYTCE